MEEIRRRDREIFLRELFSPAPLILTTLLVAFGFVFEIAFESFLWWALVLGGHTLFAYLRSVKKRFRNRKHSLLWDSCRDRLKRFHNAVALSRRRKVASFEELPKTVDETSRSIYIALRRADIVMGEVTDSEGWLLSQPPPPPDRQISSDAQAQELFRVADKNIVEYRRHYAVVLASVHRAEGQAAVFTTTLDTIRLKLLSYRLTSPDAEAENREFLEAITDAKMQLDSIDKALEELELTPYPQTITVIPDQPSDEAHEEA